MKKASKIMLFSLTVFASLFMFISTPKAVELNAYDGTNKIVQLAETCPCQERTGKCQSYFGDPTCDGCPAYWMQWAMDLIKYIAIGALLLLVTMDFFKALVQNDKDALKKAGTNAMKRFIYCVLIFFLPMIIEFIMSLFGAYGTCGIG